jgi:hypothetical protein
MDCAKICILHADFMLRDSKFTSNIAQICAEICGACAEECDKFEDDFMKNVLSSADYALKNAGKW